MKRLTLINLEINSYNGFVFELIGIETEKFDGELFAVYCWRDFLFISLLFFKFEVSNPFK
jgi:hypothetical protein